MAAESKEDRATEQLLHKALILQILFTWQCLIDLVMAIRPTIVYPA